MQKQRFLVQQSVRVTGGLWRHHKVDSIKQKQFLILLENKKKEEIV
jgi:hypothetical protein